MNTGRSRGQRGFSAIEMVITLPFLLILFVGVIELGYGLIQYLTLTKLVQNGARYAVTSITGTGNPNFNDETVKAAIRCVVVTNSSSDLSADTCDVDENKPIKNLHPSDVTITADNNFVQVDAAYHHVLLTQLGAEFLGNAKDVNTGDRYIQLSASAIMRIP